MQHLWRFTYYADLCLKVRDPVYGLNREMVVSTAPIQVCARIPGGVEAAVHYVRQAFEDKNTEAMILVDADNALNRLNRKATP